MPLAQYSESAILRTRCSRALSAGRRHWASRR